MGWDLVADALLRAVCVPHGVVPDVYLLASRLIGPGCVCVRSPDTMLGAPSFNLTTDAGRQIWVDRTYPEPTRRWLVGREVAAIHLARVGYAGDRRAAADRLGGALVLPRAALLAALGQHGEDYASIARRAGLEPSLVAERASAICRTELVLVEAGRQRAANDATARVRARSSGRIHT